MRALTKTSVAGISLAAAAALALTGCSTANTTPSGSPSDGGASTDSFEIAYEGPLTGANAAYGTYAKAGIEVALADYAKQYPDAPKVTAEYGDSQGDPALAPAVATQFISNAKILGVVGPAFSGETGATGPAYDEAGLVTVSQSATNPDLTTNGWSTFFRVVANDAAQGPAAAKMLTEIKGFTKVFVVDDSSDYGKGLGEQVRTALGSALVGSDSGQQKQTDWSATVTKVASSGAEAIYYAGYAPEAALVLKQLRDAGWQGTFASGDGTVDAAFLTAGDYTDGTLLTFPGILDAGADFQSKFDALPADAKNGAAIGAYTLESYDAAWVLLSGIAEGKTTRSDLRDWVAGYDADGLTKHIKFTSTGELDGASGVFFYDVEGGATTDGTEIK